MSLDLKQMALSGFEPDDELEWERVGEYDDGADVVTVPIDEHRVMVISENCVDDSHRSLTESLVRVFDLRSREWSQEE
jgi:hypothetical protein